MGQHNLKSVDSALASFLDVVLPLQRSTVVAIEEGDDRVLSKDVIAPIDYPHYDQCILDGYAVVAADTVGCSEGSARALALTGGERIEPGFCAVVHTGSAMPSGADALLPLEDAVREGDHVMALKEVKKGEWIWPKGAGIGKGEVMSREGMVLKPTDIVMLAKLGVSRVEVYERPKVLIVPTGDECVDRKEKLGPGLVYEANGLMCSLLVTRYGGQPTLHDIVPDDEGRLRDAVMGGMEYDLIATIGGSSASARDLMGQVVSSAGEVLFHGVALHPGNHMGAGVARNGEKSTPILFLPGYTESCAVAAFTFLDRAIRKLGHYPHPLPGREQVELTTGVSILLGVRAVRKVSVRDGKARPVKLIGESGEGGKFGYVVVPEDRGHIDAGDSVDVFYFE